MRSTNYLPDCAIDWALHMIEEFHVSRRELAALLCINRRTLDRRLSDRQGPTFYRCYQCGVLNLVGDRRTCGHPAPLTVPT